MPGLKVQSAPLIPSKQPYPTSISDLAGKIRSQGMTEVAQALELLEKHAVDVSRTLRQSPPAIHQITATDKAGNVVARIGELPTADGRMFYGLQGVSLYVGDVLGKGDPADAPVYADALGHVFIGQNGWLDVLDPYGADAAWLGAQFETTAVTDAQPAGGGLIRLKAVKHGLTSGDRPRVLDVGGVPNARGFFTVTVIDADHVDLQNSVWDGAYTSGGTIDKIYHPLTATSSGGSPALIRITLIKHGFESGDQVSIANLGQFVIKVIDVDHFDLLASDHVTIQAPGPTLRYAGGGMFSNIAIGNSFWDYHLRAFPDGTLRIKNAFIQLVGPDATITLDPEKGAITIEANPPSTVEMILNARGISIGLKAPHGPAIFIEDDGIFFFQDLGGPIDGTTFAPTGGLLSLKFGQIDLKDGHGGEVTIFPDEIDITGSDGGAITLSGVGGLVGCMELNVSGVTIDKDRHAAGFSSIDSAGYFCGGVPGLFGSQQVVQTLTVGYGSFVSDVSGPGVSTVGFATGVTNIVLSIKTLGFTGGLISGDD